MTNSLTHFEIYGEQPNSLADFYRSVFGWQVEQMPGVGYWRIQTGSAETESLHGGLTYRAIPNLNFNLDPVWTDKFMGTGGGIYAGGVFSAKDVELLSIAFDVSYTHLYAPGTRRHIKNALKAGATSTEIMEVLKLCVVQGGRACNLAVPIPCSSPELELM